MNTAIYVRVSTEDQARDGFSINAQIEKLTKYADVCSWNVIDYYIDDGISGKNIEDRGEIKRLLNDIRDGIIDNVLVYKLDRITRSMKDLIYLIDYFDKYKCTFNSQTEKIDTSNAVGRMFVKIIGIFAEFERENLSERVAFGYEQKTREGNYTNCNGVYGYDYICGSGLVINEDEAIVVNKIFNLFIHGYKYSEITRYLIDNNIPTKRGGIWRNNTISSILKNPIYIGIIRYGVRKNNSFNIYTEKVKKIISEDMFYKAQELISIK